jgi:predicted dehydrogenase
MTSADPIMQAVERGLETGQIGRPVAARILDATLTDVRTLDVRLARWLASAMAWLPGVPMRLAALGEPQDGQSTVLALLDNGSSILASAALTGDCPPAHEVLVFGDRGILSWQPDPVGSLAEIPQETAANSSLVDTILKRMRASRLRRGAVRFDDGSLIDPPANQAQRASREVDRESQQSILRRPLAAPYGVLLVAGDHTHQPGYAGAFAADPRCRMVGLVDEPDVPARRQRLNERLASRMGIPCLTDLRQALARDDVHIVCICAEPYRRGRIIVQAANAGKHLYLDKPLCASLQDADEIVASVRKANVVAQMFSQVHWETTSRTRRLIASGELGDVVAIHCDLCFAKGNAGTATPGPRRKETARPLRFELVESKRELTNVGVYAVVQQLWLLKLPVRRVYATTANHFFAEHQRDGFEDFGQLLLELEGGVVASVTAGRTGWRSHPAGGLDRTCLVGTRGVRVVDRYRPHLEVWADVEPWKAPPRNPNDPMGMWAPLPDSTYQARPKDNWLTPFVPSWDMDVGQFLDCIEYGKAPEVPAEMAAQATEVLLAAYQSAASGAWVALPLPRETP